MTIKIDLRPVDTLVPYARNARVHPDDQVAQIMASMVEFGFTAPILADDHGIVAGHGRVMAARKLYEQGRTIATPSGELLPQGMVPVIDCTGWSPTKRRAYILADNQLTLTGHWDIDMLTNELAALAEDADFDLTVTGFTQHEIDAMLARAGVNNDDIAADMSDETFWPEIKVRVHPETLGTWNSLMSKAPGSTDAAKVDAILSCVDTGALAQYVA